jgi:hypothetical protein
MDQPGFDKVISARTSGHDHQAVKDSQETACDVRRTVAARSLMGLVGFMVLMSAEVGLGAVLGRSPVNQIAATNRPVERSVSLLS